MIKELRNYQWRYDKGLNRYVNTPVDDFNHCIDAARYATTFKLRRGAVMIN